MALNRLDRLYQSLILEHASSPQNRGVLPDATHQATLLNPSCGDTVVIYARVVSDRIDAVTFQGEGCAISMASASILTQVIRGKTLSEARSIIEDFTQLVSGQEVSQTQRLQDAAILKGVAQFPARIRCAQLAWKALEDAIETNESEERS